MIQKKDSLEEEILDDLDIDYAAVRASANDELKELVKLTKDSGIYIWIPKCLLENIL
jgi:hypothetical protein